MFIFVWIKNKNYAKRETNTMTEGHIKENLSFHYLGSIITRSGAKLERPYYRLWSRCCN